ncbi:Cadherin-87A [Dissostichus eleginoides]|uniref:Cadherin-87A n=1 Tax=Dissostichus eleginoides TaxID=100907 RepID=A0AAD9BGQ1_DISEL|nr:Cadherin-87A [Dissostichus eleginoides]
MQCVGMNLQKKRRLETEPWSCRAVSEDEEEEDDEGLMKRVCLGAELQESECPMETSLTFTASNQQPEQQVCSLLPPLPRRRTGSHQTHPGSVTSQQEVPSSLPQPSNQNPLLLDDVIWPPGMTNQLLVSDVFARFV